MKKDLLEKMKKKKKKSLATLLFFIYDAIPCYQYVRSMSSYLINSTLQYTQR